MFAKPHLTVSFVCA